MIVHGAGTKVKYGVKIGFGPGEDITRTCPRLGTWVRGKPRVPKVEPSGLDWNLVGRPPWMHGPRLKWDVGPKQRFRFYGPVLLSYQALSSIN